MKCKGEFVFKSIEKREGGEFKNNNGQVVKYNPSYSLKVDEQLDNSIFERKFKIAEQNITLVQQFLALEPYTKIEIIFDVVIFNNQARIVPIDFNIL